MADMESPPPVTGTTRTFANMLNSKVAKTTKKKFSPWEKMQKKGGY